MKALVLTGFTLSFLAVFGFFFSVVFGQVFVSELMHVIALTFCCMSSITFFAILCLECD
tara:strand:- start:307 stop:483 length:177 start_codon:yes stop_codon:yes gene_type:complete